MTLRCSVLLALLYSLPVVALEPASEHTFTLAEGEQPVAVSLDDFHWLVGSWGGTMFGEPMEEVWNAPSAGSMVGMFKLMAGDTVNFYELLLITEDDHGMHMRVKHFAADFQAWEDKADFIRFDFIGMTGDAIHFDGLSFYRRSPDQIDGYILLDFSGEIREEKITYLRR